MPDITTGTARKRLRFMEWLAVRLGLAVDPRDHRLGMWKDFRDD